MTCSELVDDDGFHESIMSVCMVSAIEMVSTGRVVSLFPLILGVYRLLVCPSSFECVLVAAEEGRMIADECTYFEVIDGGSGCCCCSEEECFIFRVDAIFNASTQPSRSSSSPHK